MAATTPAARIISSSGYLNQRGEGANHTKARLPVTLVYCEEYERVDQAFRREKQVQGWSRKKKEALINGTPELLPKLAKNYAQFPRTHRRQPGNTRL